MEPIDTTNGLPTRARTNKHEHRELMELLNELRVTLPGVQVLFAFLLTVPFYQRFPTLTGLQRAVFFGAFIATGMAAVMLMAPSTYHRIMWRQEDPERLMRTANRLLIVASGLLALAIVGVVFLTADQLFGTIAAIAFASIVAALLTWTWFVLPVLRLNGRSPHGPSDDHASPADHGPADEGRDAIVRRSHVS
jgi:Family of unknown function (DUF6328)